MPPRWRSTAKPRRVVDRCPSCDVDLGGEGGGTRRIALSALERGRFFWECPECGGQWEQGPGKSTVVLLRASRARAVPPRPAPRPPVD